MAIPRGGDSLAVRIRLSRVGGKKNPHYRVVVADSRAPRDGKFIEIIGRYNPQTDPSMIEINNEKASAWLNKGAQPSDQARNLLKIAGVL
jgi:small subunit ribosomal protein S16